MRFFLTLCETLQKTCIIKGKIYCESGLHIGGSSDEIEIGGVDMTVIKHPITNEPYIPGSSIKGKMRSSLERAKGINPNGDPCGCGKRDCMVCTVFGPHKNTGHQLGPTRIIVRDASLSQKSRDAVADYIKSRGMTILEKKTENIINRAKGTAEHPRTMERVPSETEFDLEIVLQVYDTDDEKKLVQTVKDGLSWVERTYLGKGGSRGSGKVTFRDLTLDDKPFKLE